MARLRLLALVIAMGVAVFGVSGTAWAQAQPPEAGPPGTAPTVNPNGFSSGTPSNPGHHSTTNNDGTQVLGVQFTRTDNGGFLASTGADIAGTALLGFVCIGVGFVLVRRSRHKKDAAPGSTA
jgi:hypothetical protein